MQSLRRVSGGLVVVALLGNMGCHHAPAQAPEEQKVDAIVKQTGGDWARLSDTDRDALTRDIGHGNVQTARMGFQARWSRLQGGRSAAPPMPGMPR